MLLLACFSHYAVHAVLPALSCCAMHAVCRMFAGVGPHASEGLAGLAHGAVTVTRTGVTGKPMLHSKSAVCEAGATDLIGGHKAKASSPLTHGLPALQHLAVSEWFSKACEEAGGLASAWSDAPGTPLEGGAKNRAMNHIKKQAGAWV